MPDTLVYNFNMTLRSSSITVEEGRSMRKILYLLPNILKDQASQAEAVSVLAVVAAIENYY